MSDKVKSVFETVDSEGNKLFLFVTKPRANQVAEARGVFSKAKLASLKNHEAVPRSKINDLLREQEIWNDEKQAKLEDVQTKIDRLENILRKGKNFDEYTKDELELIDAIGFKLFGRKTAIALRKLRFERLLLALDLSALDDVTAEVIAENQMYDYLASQCTFYGKNEGMETKFNTRYFDSFDDYVARKSEQATLDARTEFENFYNDFDAEWQKKLLENKFLLKYKFVNDELELIDEDGNLVDEDFKPITKQEAQEIEDSVGDFE